MALLNFLYFPHEGYSSDPVIICSQTALDEKNNDTFQKNPKKTQMESKPPKHIMKTTKTT